MPKPEGALRVVCVSDTHSHHKCEGHEHSPPHIPEGDILIHAGDFTYTGKANEIEEFATFMKAQPHHTKIVIAGNHDITLDEEFYKTCDRRRFGHVGEPEDCAAILAKLDGLTYLRDTLVKVGGITIYGSPWQPEFGGWAFSLERGESCRKKWEEIPSGVDILITHGPPLGHGDLCQSGNRAGCQDLLEQIQNRIHPKFHVFGHIHEGYGPTFALSKKPPWDLCGGYHIF